MAGEQAPEKDGNEEVFEFDCPECGAHIVGETSKCPKCGVEFIIEEIEEFVCPNCGRTVPVQATVCPDCGIELESIATVEETIEEVPEAIGGETVEAEAVSEEEPRKPQDEFPVRVAEVKSLLALAKEFGVDTSAARKFIDEAIRAGKANDPEAAIVQVQKCKETIESAIDERIRDDIEHLKEFGEIAQTMGSDPLPLKTAVDRINECVESGDSKGALAHARGGMNQAEALTGNYIEARNLVNDLETLIQNSERFYIDVTEIQATVDEARKAGENGDYSMMGILAKKGREEMMTRLPGEIREEIRKAKATLMDLKAEGKDVTTLVKLLKDAGISLKRKRYEEALAGLVEFRSEVRHL